MTLDYYLQVLASLVFIAALLFVVYKFSLSYKKKIFSGELKIRDRIYLEKGVSVSIVEYKDTRYLLSVSEKNIELLKEFPLSSE